MFVTHYYQTAEGARAHVDIDAYPEACSHCERQVDFDSVQTIFYSYENEDGFDCGTLMQVVLRCTHSSCQLISIAEYSFGPTSFEGHDPFELFAVHPPRSKKNISDLLEDTRVPRSVQADLEETVFCFESRMYQAFGAMARRVIHSICAERQAVRGDLNDQIRNLLTRGIFTQQQADAAHELRTCGRHGAHPEWEPVTKEMAENSMGHLLWLLRALYQTAPDLRYREGRRRRQHLP